MVSSIDTCFSFILTCYGCTQNEKSQGEEQSVVERFNGKIIGIEPGAGVMLAAENAIETYG